MKVLVLASTFPRWRDDSTRKFIFNLCKNIDADIHVLAPHAPNAKEYELLNGVHVHRFKYFFPSGLERLAYGGGVLYNLKRSFLAKLQAPLFFLSEYFAVRKLLNKYDFDLIHAHWLMPQGFIGVKLARRFNIPCIISLHGGGSIFFDKLILGNMSEFALSNASFIIANSHFTEEIALKYSGNVKIIPQGVDTSYFKPSKKKKKNDKFVVLFVGRLIKRKGVHLLLRASEELSNKGVEIRIIGCGPLEEEVKKYANRGLIKFLGSVSDKELLKEYQSCDTFILPSIMTESGETETLGVVLLEALACGKPVIGSKIGGIPYIINHNQNGLLIKPNKKESIIKAVLRLKNKKVYNKLKKDSLTTAKKFSWKKIGKKHLRLFNEILSKNG